MVDRVTMAEGRPAAAPAVDAPLVSSRQAYRDLLVALMRQQERLYCIDTDTGLFTGADFGPAADRYVNLGLAEHNLMGVAAGLAASGKQPFVNTMAAFASARALEAIKLDVVYDNLPVRVVATHGGPSSGHLGPTHHALEDLAIMRTLPGMTVLVPADAAATGALLRQSLELPGPVYMRLGRKATPLIPGSDARSLQIGRAERLRDGDDVVIVACGPYPVMAALHAHDSLAQLGTSAEVLNMHTIKPLDVKALVDAATRCRAVVTVEDHRVTGGLGAAVAERLSELCPTLVIRVGVPETFARVPGEPETLLRLNGVSGEEVVVAALAALDQVRELDDHGG
jgi:transketolase